MKITTKVGVVLLLVAATSVIVGAGSFTSTEADRGVNVSVVGDENAYIGFHTEAGHWVNNMNDSSNADYSVELHPKQHNGEYSGDDSALIDLDIGGLGLKVLSKSEGTYQYQALNITNRFTSEFDGNISVDDGDNSPKTEDVNIGTGKDAEIELVCRSDDKSLIDITSLWSGGPEHDQNLDNYTLNIEVDGDAGSESVRFTRSVHVDCQKYDEEILDWSP